VLVEPQTGVGAMVAAEGDRDDTTFLSDSDNVSSCAACSARFIIIVDNPLPKGRITCAEARREYPEGSRKTRKTYVMRSGGS
jgi:hypothetical protein